MPFGPRSCTSELQLKVNCRIKFELARPTVSRPAQIFSYNSLSVYNCEALHEFYFETDWRGAAVDFIITLLLTKLFFSKGSAFGVHTLLWFLGIFPQQFHYLPKKLFSCQKCDYEINSTAPSVRFKNKIDKESHNWQ